MPAQVFMDILYYYMGSRFAVGIHNNSCAILAFIVLINYCPKEAVPQLGESIYFIFRNSIVLI